MVVEVKVFPEQITIENFKSIKRITLKLKPGVNLLVGPNRAGKTNILEAIYFLSKALSREELLKIPYAPHVRFSWAPEELFFMKYTENPIVFGVDFRIVKRVGERHLKHVVKLEVRFAYSRSRLSVEPVYIAVNWGCTRLEATGSEVRVYVSTSCISSFLELIHGVEEKDLMNLYTKLMEIGEKLGRIERGEYMLLDTATLEHENAVQYIFLHNFSAYTSLHKVYDSGDTQKELWVSSIALPYARKPLWLPVLVEWVTTLSKEFTGFLTEATDPLHLDLYTPLSIVSRALLLKHPDIEALTKPQPLYGEDELDMRAFNLSRILYKLSAERRTRAIEHLLNEVFGNIAIEPRSTANMVFFTVREGSIELSPRNTADGIIKVLAIATAVELNPSILLIDEIENSLHVEAIQKIFDFLNNLEILVLVATHSPAVIDLVDLDRLIIVSRGSDGSTNVEYIEDVKSVRKRLLELGVSHSEYILYGKTMR
jgi:energy-coupling factor transporter ATP-binding protein EcfA2